MCYRRSVVGRAYKYLFEKIKIITEKTLGNESVSIQLAQC